MTDDIPPEPTGTARRRDSHDRPSLEDVYRARIALGQAIEAWRRHANYGDAHGELLEVERRHDELYSIEAARLGIDPSAPPWSGEGATGSGGPH